MAKDATSPEVLIALELLWVMEQEQPFSVPTFTEKVRKAYLRTYLKNTPARVARHFCGAPGATRKA